MVLRPARKVPEVQPVAIAARDPVRAEAFARKYGIGRVLASYETLLRDSGIDAVYVPLPNSLHCDWVIRALELGKHVLCEKPLAANAEEARRMTEAADRTGLVLGEAMHYRHHPLAKRIGEIIDSGVLGKIRHVEASNCFPIFRRSDIRYSYALGGGATMDLGCYAIDLLRMLVREEPAVESAQALLASEGVDRRMEARLRFPGGATARMVCSLWSKDFLKSETRIEAENGSLVIANPNAPHLFHALKWDLGGQKKTERLKGTLPTAVYQLRAFADSVRTGAPFLTDGRNAQGTLRVIDAIYERAGLPIRGAESSLSAGGR
jgi:predicted dehydrogenase